MSRWKALPQSQRLAEVVADLEANPDVVAIWLGGSLARGAGDAYSDVDLCIALRPEAYAADEIPASAARLTAAAVTLLPFHFGGEATLWHMMLEDGTIYDLHVQPADEAPPRGVKLALACRDEAFGEKLISSEGPPLEFPPARAEEIARALQFFWMNQRKHQKVLYRRLPLMAWQGEVLSRQDLVRFWYILATGNDCGPLHRLTIHTLTPVVRAVQTHIGPDALALVGQPTRTPAELIAAMTHLHDEIARVGRALADQLGFDYPAAAEATARRTWQEFLADAENQQIANWQTANDV
jgi:predicted nucleotidyltransferase